MNDTNESSAQGGPPWLLLIHQLPPRPDYFRVKVRRRLRKIGAAAIKNSVYVLPNTEEALEDFQWLVRSIEADGGEAMVCEAGFIEGITDEEVAAMFSEQATVVGDASREAPATKPSGAVWATREGVKVDRIASAWLIRRFIDPAAHFKFVPARGYQPDPGELRFDMYRAEYTHEGDRCTFETLGAQFALDDPALRAIGEIVHDIDCKDEKFGRAETDGIASLVQGIAQSHPRDEDRLTRGAAAMDDLYAWFTRAHE
jgi:hypothetical protein